MNMLLSAIYKHFYKDTFSNKGVARGRRPWAKACNELAVPISAS